MAPKVDQTTTQNILIILTHFSLRQPVRKTLTRIKRIMRISRKLGIFFQNNFQVPPMESLMDPVNQSLSKPKEFKLQMELKIQHWNQFQGHKLHPHPRTARISQVRRAVAQQHKVALDLFHNQDLRHRQDREVRHREHFNLRQLRHH